MNKKNNNLLFFMTVFGLITSNFGCNNKLSKDQNNSNNLSLKNKNNDAGDRSSVNSPTPPTITQDLLDSNKNLLDTTNELLLNNPFSLSLNAAAGSGLLSIVQHQVQAGTDVNTKSNHGFTPLHSAIRGGHLDTVQFLIESGADVNAVNCDQDTPLHFAAETSEKLSIVQLLIRSGVDVNALNRYGNTPLFFAFQYQNFLVAKLLIESGANINVITSNDWHETFDKSITNASINPTFENFEKLVTLLSLYIYHTCSRTLKLNDNNQLIHFVRASYQSSTSLQEKNPALIWMITHMLDCKSKTQLVESILKYFNNSNIQSQEELIEQMNYFFSQEELFTEFKKNLSTFKKKFSSDLLKNIENNFRYEYAQKLKRKIFSSFDENTINQLVNSNTLDDTADILDILRANLIKHSNSTKIKSPFIKTIIKSTQANRNKKLYTFSKAELESLLMLIKDVRTHLDYIIKQKGNSFNSPTSFGSNLSKDILY